MVQLNESEYLQRDNKNLFDIFSFNTDIDWGKSQILDFGCNVGNFLNYAPDQIKENYTGVDINLSSIKVASHNHSDQKFIHYDKWHVSFNPTGSKLINITDVINEKFDVIILYSVFTHSTISQTRQELNNLKAMLNPGGKILFTIWDHSILDPFYRYICETTYLKNILDCNKITYNTVAYLIDGETIHTDVQDLSIHSCKSLFTFYKLNKFCELFPEAKLISTPQQANIKNHHQTMFAVTT
jgi:2-polyprenyl-3-methyl-5-hydroxy-6-metoxy-1,4-benzoquinol methylase